MMKLFISAVLFLTLTTSSAWAWGERGHHMICQIATRLVVQPELNHFLKSRGDMMGHVCNLPDISWRELDKPPGLATLSHFLNPEVAGFSIEQVPTNLDAYLAMGNPKDSREKRAGELGTLWWRADQFFRRAVANAKQAAASNAKEKIYTDSVYGFLTNLALMGHFVGDSTMPYHTSLDYNGFATGHGGIHSFYESVCVDQLSLGIAEQVFEKAKSDHEFDGTSLSVLEQLRAVSLASSKERPEIDALDEVLAPSSVFPRKLALRKPPALACGKFEKLLIADLARAALALARFWDMAYVQGGTPNLKNYHSYRYPMTLDLVPVDYVN